MTVNDITWLEMTRYDLEKMSFHCKSPGEGCRRPTTCVWMCNSQEGNDVTCPEVTRSDTEVTSFHRKWPGEGCSVFVIVTCAYKAPSQHHGL